MFHLGDHVFDRQAYDPGTDVLSVWKSFGIDGVPSDEPYDSPEGHVTQYDNRGRLVSIDFVDAAAWVAQEGVVKITLKDETEPLLAGDVAEALANPPGEDDGEDEHDDEESYPRLERPGEKGAY
jgi:hypothetical protein